MLPDAFVTYVPDCTTKLSAKPQRSANMSALGQLHLATAFMALTTGGCMLWRPKGTPGHRRIGWLYVASMLTLNGTALLIYRLTGRFGPFHIAALVSLAMLLAGVIPVLWRRPAEGWLERHYFFMAHSYLGLTAAAIAETATRMLGAHAFAGRPTTFFWVAVVLATVLVFVVGSRVIKRRAVSTLRPFQTTRSDVSRAPAI